MKTFRKYFIFLIAVFSALLLIKLLENSPDSDAYIVFQLKAKTNKKLKRRPHLYAGRETGRDLG